LWPALLVAAALLAFVQRRERTTYVLLALAVAAKVYPIVLLPIALIESGRARARSALLWFFGVLVVVHLPFAILGPGGLRFSYRVQITRGLEVESLGGGLLLALHHVHLAAEAPGSTNVVGGLGDAVATITSLVALAGVLLAAWLYLRGRRDPFVAASAAVVAFILCCVVVRGGPLDSTRYGDVHLYSTYAHQMRGGEWPYGDFFDEYPPLAQPLFLGVELLPGMFSTDFKLAMMLLGAA